MDSVNVELKNRNEGKLRVKVRPNLYVVWGIYGPLLASSLVEPMHALSLTGL